MPRALDYGVAVDITAKLTNLQDTWWYSTYTIRSGVIQNYPVETGMKWLNEFEASYFRLPHFRGLAHAFPSQAMLSNTTRLKPWFTQKVNL